LSLKTLSSRENPIFRELLALSTDRRARRECGKTLLDGPHLLESAIQGSISVERLVYSQSAADGPLAEWQQRLPGVPAVVLSERLFAALSPVDTPTGLLSVIATPIPDLRPAEWVMLLECIQDPGNLGALFRVAAASGVEAVYLSKGCADAWSPKCLRGSQGAHFRLRIHEGEDLPKVVRAFHGTVHAAVLGAQATLFELDLKGSVGFAFGNEGTGLSEALRAECRPFSIPMPGGIESLNVATAAAICLFRSEERRVGKECRRLCRSRWSPYH
jgi:TrmH family RNA methyltransferase